MQMKMFGDVWQKHPLLYDTKLHDKAFKRDYQGTLKNIHDAYAELSCICSTSVNDCKKRRVKYRDGLTKAVWQYKCDLKNQTVDMPVPAIRKLLAFQWLMKHSEHYENSSWDRKIF